MSDYSLEISLADHKRGDKWSGIGTIGPITINGSQPASTLARIRMCFKYRHNIYSLDSEDGEITITDSSTWEASVPEVQDFLSVAGDWEWDMEFYETGDTSPLTLFKGVITVHEDIC